MAVWTRKDRGEYGYSTSIFNALCKAHGLSDYDDVRRIALEVIEREIENGARIDEDFPATIPWFFHRSLPIQNDSQHMGIQKIACYIRIRNLFLFGLYLGDKAILAALLIRGLPDSIQTSKIQLCVLTSATSETPGLPTVTSRNSNPNPMNISRILQAESWNGLESCAINSGQGEFVRPPWLSYNQQSDDITFLWADTDIAALWRRCSGEASGNDTIKEMPVDDRILHWAFDQLLQPTGCPILESIAIVEKGGRKSIVSPDIPLTTLSILLCDSCGFGCVIGWYDWVVEGGKLVEGMMPTDWAMNYATCNECHKARLGNGGFNENHLSIVVQKWLGDFDLGPSDWSDWVFDEKALFSWCENHFQFLSLSLEEGLKPLDKEGFPRSIQFFRLSTVRICPSSMSVWSLLYNCARLALSARDDVEGSA
ncbi:uncharacterized protein FFNC_15398 [Fusarium fujikuroi]|nr:uncharacterized protein FFNC_15398 [Fusarium fujikuroi]